MKLQIGIGITAKLISVVTIIILAAIGAVVFVATDMYEEDSITKIQEVNTDNALSIANATNASLTEAVKKMSLMAKFVSQSEISDATNEAIENTVSTSDDLIAFYAYWINEKQEVELKYFYIADTALSEFALSEAQLKTLPEASILNQQKNKSDEILFFNTAQFTNKPIYSISFMSKHDASLQTNVFDKNSLAKRWIYRADYRSSLLLKHLSYKRSMQAYIVDSNAKLIAHSDKEWQDTYFINISWADKAIVQKFIDGQMSNHQMQYKDPEQSYMLAAFKRLDFAGLAVVVEAPKAQVVASIEQVKNRAFWISVLVLCLAFFINFAFSQSITEPVVQLFEATQKIMNANFDVHIRAQSTDEIGALSIAFNNMAKGLKERDLLKTTFNKFHSKEVAKKLLSSELKLGGERRTASVFFSDIRGFTEMSEKMHADEVVSLLNSYLSEMVRIIYKWHGVVDKYIGDAIMAVWGVPESTPDDAYRAIRCALEMRQYMLEFNAKLKSQNKTGLSIGIGLHTGDLVAGNIGSDERLEYTVIGDTVNLASRIESANKLLNADILISASTYYELKERGIVVGPELKINAKGKSQAIVVHQVIGYKESGELKTSLTKEQIDFIKNQSASISESEEKISLSSVQGESTQKSSSYISNISSDSEANLKAAGLVSENHTNTAQFNASLLQHSQVSNSNVVYNTAIRQQNTSTLSLPPQNVEMQRLSMTSIQTAFPHAVPNMIDSFTPQSISPMPSPTADMSLHNSMANSYESISPQSQSASKPVLNNLFGNDIDTPQLQPAPAAFTPNTQISYAPKVANEEDIVEWFIVREMGHGAQMGPYSMNQIKNLLQSGQLQMQNDMVFKPGDFELRPLYNLKVFNRRGPVAEIQHPLPGQHIINNALASEWFIAGENSQVRGPYTLKQLHLMHDSGQLARNAFVWRGGLSAWIYLFQTPSFDRRHSA